MLESPKTITEVLTVHAHRRALESAFTMLEDGTHESDRRTWAGLEAAARRIGAWLSANGLARRPVLLLINQSLAFIDAFMGCLYAGTIAVPVAMPRPNRSPRTLQLIVANAGVAAILCTTREMEGLRQQFGAVLPQVPWLCIEDADDGPPLESPQPSDTAFLQYTSGSTGAPKGVVVTHTNLMSNEEAIRTSMRLSASSRFVGWLPLFHDMGLIGNVLQSIYLGTPCVLMPPMIFAQRPLRWLEAIHRYRATIGGGPNFAYDLCVERTTPEQRAGLDLSCWEVAFNGAEPVRLETLERFAAAFAVAGFRKCAFLPCYGMAENTLMVTGCRDQSGPVANDVPVSAGESVAAYVSAAQEGKARHVVSCGTPVLGTRVLIVDPATATVLPEQTVGEIWMSGPSVSPGYYNSSADTAKNFGARLAGGAGPFLRSGDLGFLQDERLFVTGRIKDLIIVRGRNYYPQDLEESASHSNPQLVRGGGAAFTMEQEGRNVLVLVHELTRDGWLRGEPDRIAADIKEAIGNEHDLVVHQVVLIRPGSLPRTSSGKVQRSLCREMVAANSFDPVAPVR
jgi:acyl-CoA synthetase (AMP-forming)/AMP-acid ligase II